MNIDDACNYCHHTADDHYIGRGYNVYCKALVDYLPNNTCLCTYYWSAIRDAVQRDFHTYKGMPMTITEDTCLCGHEEGDHISELFRDDCAVCGCDEFLAILLTVILKDKCPTYPECQCENES